MLYSSLTLATIWVTVEAQSNWDIYEAVICLEPGVSQTISCEGGYPHAFINLEGLLDYPKRVYSPSSMYMCPKREVDVYNKQCEEDTTIAQERCHTEQRCELYERDISRPLYRCSTQFQGELPITANILIFKYKCFTIQFPRDILFETKYLERDISAHMEDQNLFSPRFPYNISAYPQNFTCQFFSTFPEGSIASILLKIKYLHLVGQNREQSLTVHVDNNNEAVLTYSSPFIHFLDLLPEIVRFKHKMVLSYEKRDAKVSGKLWIAYQSNVSLHIKCLHEMFETIQASEDTDDIETNNHKEDIDITTKGIPRDQTTHEEVSGNDSNMTALIIIGVIAGVLIAVTASAIAVFILYKRRKKKQLPNLHSQINFYSEIPANTNKRLVNHDLFTKQDGNANIISLQDENIEVDKCNQQNIFDIECFQRRWNTSNMLLHTTNTLNVSTQPYDHVEIRRTRWDVNDDTNNLDYSQLNKTPISNEDLETYGGYDTVKLFGTLPELDQLETSLDKVNSYEQCEIHHDSNSDQLPREQDIYTYDNRLYTESNELNTEMSGRDEVDCDIQGKTSKDSGIKDHETMMMENSILYESISTT